MSLTDDERDEMRGLLMDAGRADAFLAGRVAPDDAPPGLRDLATLIQAAKPPASAGGGAVEGQAVAAFAAAVRAPVGVSANVREGKNGMIVKLLSVKVAVVAATLAFGATAAAAATGSLPSPIQSAVSGGLSDISISVPNPNSHASSHATLAGGNANSHASPHAKLGAGNAKDHPSSHAGLGAGNAKDHPSSHAGLGAGNANGQGNSGSSATADAYGQCTAWAAATLHTSVSGIQAQDTFPKLRALAQAQGETIAQYCATVTRPSPPPSTLGSTHVPTSTPAGPPTSIPAGPPTSVPAGPPTSTPAGPPTSIPAGRPSGVPANTHATR